MKFFDQQYLDRQKLTHDLLRMINSIAECKGKQDLYRNQSPQVLKTLIDIATIQSTESSNRIEGVTAPHQRIVDLVLDKATPKNRSEAEIFGYRYALDLIHQNHRHMPVSENLVLQLHKELFRYADRPGGQWKTTDNLIEEFHADGSRSVRFRPTAAYLTPLEMEQLHTACNQALEKSHVAPILLIATYVLDLLCIHPFTDGNGRVSRLVTLLLLHRTGYDVGRYISLEKIIEDTKKGYYDSLKQSSLGWHESSNDLIPWWTYFCFVVLEAYKQFEARLGSIEQTKGLKTTTIVNAIHLFLGEFSIQEIQEQCPTVGIDLIRKVLQQEKQAGRIECLGRGPQAKWKRIT